MPHFAGIKGKRRRATAHIESLSIEDKLKYAIINGEKTVGEGEEQAHTGRTARRSIDAIHARST